MSLFYRMELGQDKYLKQSVNKARFWNIVGNLACNAYDVRDLQGMA